MNVREKSASKKIQKRHKINKISTLTYPNNCLQNAMKVEIF